MTFNGIHDVPKRKSKKLLLIMKVEKSINVKPYNFFYLIIITKQYPKLYLVTFWYPITHGFVVFVKEQKIQ